jgi:hypothetical protein
MSRSRIGGSVINTRHQRPARIKRRVDRCAGDLAIAVWIRWRASPPPARRLFIKLDLGLSPTVGVNSAIVSTEWWTIWAPNRGATSLHTTPIPTPAQPPDRHTHLEGRTLHSALRSCPEA